MAEGVPPPRSVDAGALGPPISVSSLANVNDTGSPDGVPSRATRRGSYLGDVANTEPLSRQDSESGLMKWQSRPNPRSQFGNQHGANFDVQ